MGLSCVGCCTTEHVRITQFLKMLNSHLSIGRYRWEKSMAVQIQNKLDSIWQEKNKFSGKGFDTPFWMQVLSLQHKAEMRNRHSTKNEDISYWRGQVGCFDELVRHYSFYKIPVRNIIEILQSGILCLEEIVDETEREDLFENPEEDEYEMKNRKLAIHVLEGRKDALEILQSLLLQHEGTEPLRS